MIRSLLEWRIAITSSSSPVGQRFICRLTSERSGTISSGFSSNSNCRYRSIKKSGETSSSSFPARNCHRQVIVHTGISSPVESSETIIPSCSINRRIRFATAFPILLPPTVLSIREETKERKASLKSAALSLSSAIVTSWGKSFLNAFVNCEMSYESNLLLIISKYFWGRIIECYFEVICLQI